MRLQFHPEALSEYEEAARYYAGCQTGLELRFITSVETAVFQIQPSWIPDRLGTRSPQNLRKSASICGHFLFNPTDRLYNSLQVKWLV
jgi:hypothetical protein